MESELLDKVEASVPIGDANTTPAGKPLDPEKHIASAVGLVFVVLALCLPGMGQERVVRSLSVLFRALVYADHRPVRIVVVYVEQCFILAANLAEAFRTHRDVSRKGFRAFLRAYPRQLGIWYPRTPVPRACPQEARQPICDRHRQVCYTPQSQAWTHSMP